MKRIILVLFMGMLLVSCASVSVNNASVSHLRKRVDAYYKAKITADYREAFRYENMSLDERFTEKFYSANALKSSMEYLEARVISVSLDEKNKNRAVVKMRLKLKLQPMQGFEGFSNLLETAMEDRWEYKEGNWYHIIKGLTREW